MTSHVCTLSRNLLCKFTRTLPFITLLGCFSYSFAFALEIQSPGTGFNMEVSAQQEAALCLPPTSVMEIPVCLMGHSNSISSDGSITMAGIIGDQAVKLGQVKTDVTTGKEDQARRLRAADLDGDGDKDILSVPHTGGFAAHENPGANLIKDGLRSAEDQIFLDVQPLKIAGKAVPNIAALAVDHQYYRYLVFLDNKIDEKGFTPNCFVERNKVKLPKQIVMDMHTMDLDGDGTDEVLLVYEDDTPGSSYNSYIFMVKLKNSNNYDFDIKLALPSKFSVTDIQQVDIDGDKDKDLVVFRYGPMMLFEKQSSGEYSIKEYPKIWMFSNYPDDYNATFGDLDNDGDLDILLPHYFGGFNAWINNGQNDFPVEDMVEFEGSKYFTGQDYRAELVISNDEPKVITFNHNDGGKFPDLATHYIKQ